MNIASNHNIGPHLLAVIAQLNYSATAGTTPDNVEQNGQAIDRLKDGRKLYHSAMLVINYKAVVNTSETFSLAANGQQDTSSGFATAQSDMVASRAYQVEADGTLTELTLTSGALALTSMGGGATIKGVVVMEFDLHDAPQYIRSQITSDLSRSGTDTSIVSANWVSGGANVLPAT